MDNPSRPRAQFATGELPKSGGICCAISRIHGHCHNLQVRFPLVFRYLPALLAIRQHRRTDAHYGRCNRGRRSGSRRILVPGLDPAAGWAVASPFGSDHGHCFHAALCGRHPVQCSGGAALTSAIAGEARRAAGADYRGRRCGNDDCQRTARESPTQAGTNRFYRRRSVQAESNHPRPADSGDPGRHPRGCTRAQSMHRDHCDAEGCGPRD